MLDAAPSKNNEGMISCQNGLCGIESPNNETRVYKNETISFLIRTSKSAGGNSSEFSLSAIESAPEAVTTSDYKLADINKTVEEMKETLKFKFDIKTENAKQDDQDELNQLGYLQRPNPPLQEFSDQAGPQNRYSPLMYDKPVSNYFKGPENIDYGDYGSYRSDEKPRHSIVKKHLGYSEMDSPVNFQNDAYKDNRLNLKGSDDSSEVKKQRKESRISKNKISSTEKKISSDVEDIKTKKTFINMKKPSEKKVDVPEDMNKIVYEKIEYIGKTKLNEGDDTKVQKQPVKKTKFMPNYEIKTDEKKSDLRKTSNNYPSLETSYSSPINKEVDPYQQSSRDEESKVDPSGLDYLAYDENKSPEFDINGMQPNDGAAYENDPYYNEAEKNVEDEVRNSLLLEKTRSIVSKKSNSDYDENLGGADANAEERNVEMYESQNGDIEGGGNQLDENSLDDSEMGNSLEDEDQLDDYQTSKVSSGAELMNLNSLGNRNFDQVLNNKGGVHSIPKPGSDYKSDKSFSSSKTHPVSESQNSRFPSESFPMNEEKEFQQVEKFHKNTNKVMKNRKNMYNQTSRLKNERKSEKQLLKEAYFRQKEERKFASSDNNDNNKKNFKNPANNNLKSSQKFKQTEVTAMASQNLETPRNPTSELIINPPKASSPIGASKSKGLNNHLQEYDYDDEDIEFEDDDEEYDNEDDDYAAITKFGKGKVEKDKKNKSNLISEGKEKLSPPYKKISETVLISKSEPLMKRSQLSKPDGAYNVKIDIQDQHKRDNDKTIRSYDPYPKKEIIEYAKKLDVKEKDMESESLEESKEGPTENLYKPSLNETRKLDESKLSERDDEFNQNPSYGFQGNPDDEKEDFKEVLNLKKSSFQDDRWTPSKQKQYPGYKRRGNQLNKGSENIPGEAKGRNIIASRKSMQKKADYKLYLAEKQGLTDNRKLSSKNNAKLNNLSTKKISQQTEPLEEAESLGEIVNEETSDVNYAKNYQKNFQNNYKQEPKIAPSKKFSMTQRLFREDSSLPKNNLEKTDESPNLPSAQDSELTEDPDDREVLELGLQLLNREKELDEIENQETMSQNINGNEQNQNSYLGQNGKQFPVAPFMNIPRYKKSSSKLDELLGKEINSLRNNDKLKGVNTNKKAALKEIKIEKQIKEDKIEEEEGSISNTNDTVDEFDETGFNSTNSWLIMNEEETIEDDQEKTKVKESKIFKEVHKSKGKPNKPKPRIALPSVEQNKFTSNKYQSKIEQSEEDEEISSDDQKTFPTLPTLEERKPSVKRRGEDTLTGGVKKPVARKRQLFRKIKRRDNSLNTFEKSLSDSVMEAQVKFTEKKPVTESNVLDADSGNIYYMTIGTTTQDEKVDDFVHFKE